MDSIRFLLLYHSDAVDARLLLDVPRAENFNKIV